MHSVLELLEPRQIERRARPSDLRRGKAIAEEGEVEILEEDEGHLVARAGSEASQTRRVEFDASDGRLHWRCTCGAERFCQHCVAVALTASQARH